MDTELRMLQKKECKRIEEDILTKTMYKYNVGYQYLFPNHERSRHTICSNLHQLFIHRNTKEQPFHFKSYVLLDNEKNHIGHILVKPPTSKNSSKKGADYNEPILLILKFFLLSLFNYHILCNSDIFLFWRLFKILMAKKWVHYTLQIYYANYWNLSWISINEKYIGKGYGTEMIKLTHKLIKNKYSNNNYNDNHLIFLCTEGERAAKFYQKNGYKIFVQIRFDHDFVYYGLIYHWNTQFLDKAIKIFKQKYPTQQDFKNQLVTVTKTNFKEVVFLITLFPFWIIAAVICRFLKLVYSCIY